MATKKTAAKSPAKAAAKTATKTAAKKSASVKIAAKTPATHAQIAALAHKYFTERGHKHGSHHDDWLRAEKELNS